MNLDWTALGQVTAVSLAATVAVVTVFTLGVLGLARHEQAHDRAHEQEPGHLSEGAHEVCGASALGLAQAGLCFLACVAVVAYGIWLIVPRFP
jgi:hypothetical protein